MPATNKIRNLNAAILFTDKAVFQGSSFTVGYPFDCFSFFFCRLLVEYVIRFYRVTWGGGGGGGTGTVHGQKKEHHG